MEYSETFSLLLAFQHPDSVRYEEDQTQNAIEMQQIGIRQRHKRQAPECTVLDNWGCLISMEGSRWEAPRCQRSNAKCRQSRGFRRVRFSTTHWRGSQFDRHASARLGIGLLLCAFRALAMFATPGPAPLRKEDMALP